MHGQEDGGIKIPPRSADETVDFIAHALERLYQDMELRSKMSQTGRAGAEQIHRWDHLGERLWKIYEEVLGAFSQET